jgi:hypothetical protein
MATWQYNLVFVPKRAVDGMGQLRPLNIPHNCEDETNYWREFEDSESLARRFSNIVPESESWSTEIRMWGDEDSNRIDLVYEGERVVECLIRIDTSNFSHKFLIEVLKVAVEMKLLAWTEEGYIFEPDFKLIESLMNRSEAASFSKDPEGFISRIASKRKN